MGSSILSNRSITRSAQKLTGFAACVLFSLGCALLSPDAAHGAQRGAPLGNPQLPISLDAASSDFDYRKNVLVFRKVRISQGELSVQADKATATGLDFKDSQWTFVGAVRIRVPNGLLDSDAATVNFSDNQIAEAKITGAPAQFEQRRKDSNKVTRGRAGLIEYNVEGGIVKLSNQAWLTDGASEITGQTLVYNIRDERVLANPGEKDRQGVSITIRPGEKPIVKNAPKPKPEPGAAGSADPETSPGSGASGSAP